MKRARVLLVAILLAVFGCRQQESGGKMSEEDLETLRTLLRDREQAMTTHGEQRRRALREAWKTIKPDPAAGKCKRPIPDIDSVEFEVHSVIVEARMLAESFDLEKDMAGSNDLTLRKPRKQFGERKQPTMMDHIRAEIALQGPRVHVVGNGRSGIERLIEQGHWDKGHDRDSSLPFYINYAERFDWELAIVAEQNVRPEHDGRAFVGGRVRGRAYLYDYKADRVVCTSDVAATNSSVQVLKIDPANDSVRGHQTLEDDLDRRAYKQAVEGLVSVSHAANAGRQH